MSALSTSAGVGQKWELPNEKAAVLLRHYVVVLSTWVCFTQARSYLRTANAVQFDLTDPYRHFGVVVPRLAIGCPALQKAILCVSATHLQILTGDDSYAADYFLQQCLELLIPRLDEEGADKDECLLAASVLLRLIEELQSKTTVHPTLCYTSLNRFKAP